MFRTFLIALLLSQPAVAELTSPFQNIDQLRSAIGIQAYESAPFRKKVRVAILDQGFRGYKAQIGKSIPSGTVYRPGPIAIDPKTEESHGLAMAQIMAGVLEQVPDLQYELHLFSAFGFSNFKAAVDEVVRGKFDVVLYAQVWEYGGNGDARGFINATVDQAIKAGVIWINAAGNFGLSTYRTEIKAVDDDWIRLPGANDTVRLRCQAPRKKKCQLRVVLSWNDFKDSVEEGTDKDLDLLLTDDTLRIVKSSALSQKKSFPEGETGSSLYPREIVQAEVEPGVYFIRVKDRSRNFDPKRDELRLTVSGDHVTLQDNSPGETLLPPADNPKVITVGAADSERSSSSRSSRKPELTSLSKVVLENDETYLGTSNAAAVAAAASTVLRALYPRVTRDEVVRALSSGASVTGGSGRGLSLETLQFAPTGPGCFRLTNLPFLPRAIEPFRKAQLTIVQTTRGVKIFTKEDPFTYLQGVERTDDDDMLVVGPNGIDVLPRSAQLFLSLGTYELVQIPENQFICTINGQKPQVQSATPRLRLPPLNTRSQAR